MDTEHTAPSLPDWLEELLPEPVAPHVLSTVVVAGKRILRLTSPRGETTDFDGIREVAEAKQLESLDLAVEDEVYEHFGDKRLRMLTYGVDEPGQTGLLLAYSDAKRRATLERAYGDHLEARKRYEADPQDFAKAWRFIDTHPAFWTAYDIENHPWHWETEGYCSKLRQDVYRSSKDGLPVVQLEGGGHVPSPTAPGAKAYQEHYGDWRLEVRAHSFEEAIVELAFRVANAFDSQGNSLDESDFPYAAPEWIRDLRERITEEDSRR